MDWLVANPLKVLEDLWSGLDGQERGLCDPDRGLKGQRSCLECTRRGVEGLMSGLED